MHHLGECLLAYRSGEDSPEAMVGAMLEAQFMVAMIGAHTTKKKSSV